LALADGKRFKENNLKTVSTVYLKRLKPLGLVMKYSLFTSINRGENKTREKIFHILDQLNHCDNPPSAEL
jgi:hypothetical protein